MSSRAFLLRATVAAAAVSGFGAHAWTGWDPFWWLGLLLYCVCFALYAKTLAIALTRMKRVTADLLIVTVMAVSLAAGQPLSGALVAWFIGMGLFLSFTIIERTRRLIEALAKQRDKVVRVVRDGKLLTLPLEEVRRADVAVIAAGEIIAVDGEIVEGRSSIDEAAITGEPFALFKQPGDRVTSGGVNLTSPLKVRVAKDGRQGFYWMMASEIEAALQRKAVIHRTADRIVPYFISGVVLYAAGVFFLTGGLTGQVEEALLRTAAVTAVACPCAWALSVPTAFAAGIGGLSSLGILARGGVPLESAGRAVNVVLDKTGTLTLGKPKIGQITSFGPPEENLLRIAASVEAGFSHPVADAIVAHAAARGIRPLDADRFEYLPGIGVKAVVQGRRVVLGSADTMSAAGLVVPSGFEARGRVTWIGVDDCIAGAVVIRDEMSEAAGDLGSALRTLGIRRIEMATGDNEASEARRVAALIGADDVHWGLTPEGKAEIVKRLGRQGATVMVGDGVNDAVALAAADVGVSVGRSNADLAIRSSDIVLLGDDAASLPVVIGTGRKLIRVIRQNYAWAIGFNTVGIALATAGVLSPWLAALFHHLSSVLVVANSARLVRPEKWPGADHK